MFKTNKELLKAFRDNFCTPCTAANTCGDCVLQTAWSVIETPANKVLHSDPPSACEDCGSVDPQVHYSNCPLAKSAGR